MQEDFPCQINQESYQMHIEPNEMTFPKQMNSSQSKLKPLRNSLNEVETPKNQKAILQLDNDISLSLDVKHTFLNNASFQKDSFSQLIPNCSGLQSFPNDLDPARVSIGTKFEYKNNKFTSVVVIQIKDQIYNIISDMSFINQLKSTHSDDKLQELCLTKQNLQSLPDDSGKIKNKQIRKGSDNSNDSDATQPLTSAQTEVLYNASNIYNCYKCGAQNNIQQNVNQQNLKQNIQQTNVEEVNLVQQNLNQINACVTQQQANNITQQDIKNESIQDEEKVNIPNKQKRVRKQAIRYDQGFSQEANQKQNDKQKTPLNNQNNIKQDYLDQKDSLDLDEQQAQTSFKKRKEFELEEPYKYQNYLIRDFCQIYDQILQQQNENLDKSQEHRENQDSNSDINQMQNESNNHSLYQIGKSSQICGQNYSIKENSIYPDILINQGSQLSPQQNPSQSFRLKDNKLSDQLFLLDKSNKNIQDNNSNSTIDNKHNQNNSKIMSDITNFDNIASFSCTSFASSPIIISQNVNTINIHCKENQIKLYEKSQTQDFNSFTQIDNELLKENEASNQNTQSSLDQKQQDMFNNSDDDDEDEETFTDEFIAKADKKNVVKNFVKAFMSDVKKDESILNSLDEINQKDSKKSTYSQRLKKFQNYMKKSKFNNQFIKQLISNSEYSLIFQSFLLNKADDWLSNSNVQDKETHRKLLKFFQLSIHNEDILNKLKTLKKSKRNPNSSTIKTNQIMTPNTFFMKSQASTQRISPFTNISQQISETRFYKNEEKSMSQFLDGDNMQSETKINIEEQKDEYINTLNCIPSIQQALNDIQINNQFYLIQQSENQNLL